MIPILYVRKRVRHLLETAPCPYCRRSHTHGAGSKPFGTLCYGHRVEHCSDWDLQRAQKHLPRGVQRTRYDLHGYFLIDPRAAKMTEAAMATLFDEMDEIGKSFARVKEPEDANFFWTEFKIAVRDRLLELTFKQQRELFDIWLDHHRRGCVARRAALPKRVAELTERARDRSQSLGYKYLRKRQRAKMTAELAAVQNEIAALVAPPEYTGPLATWGDAA